MEDLIEKITEQFIIKILSGKWASGEWIPPERVLAEEFQVGRPTVHTVLIRLQEIGLVQIVPRHGVKVVDFLLNGKIGVVEIIIELFRNEIPDTMKRSLYKFIYDNLTIIVENCLAEGYKSKPYFSAVDFTFNDKDAFSQMVFNFYQNLSIETQNMIYPLLVNSLKNGIMNAASYVKDKEVLYNKLISLEKAIINGNSKQARNLNHDILLSVYSDWK